ncbi:MAG: YeeE/YedE family protein [Chlamydiia bacterium]|nr:YeeE/YedE family protein [Chlamydiia bacterium]
MQTFIALLKKDRWSPYLVGALLGVLEWIVFGWMHHELGVSTTFVHISAMIAALISPEYLEKLTYFQETLAKSPLINWQFMLVIGVLIGAFLASWLSKSYFGSKIPRIWQANFGVKKAGLFFTSFIGGIVIIFGARLAGGCTSGHGLSGGLQLAISSWIFLASFFIAGIIFTQIFYKKG